MSLFTHLMAECPACQARFDIEVVASVAGDRRPDLKAAIIDGSFQQQTCPSCSAGFRLPPRFTYMDFDRGQWFLAHPLEDAGEWTQLEKQAIQLFDERYGDKAPASAREIGEGIKPRIVFGWLATREKLLCDIADLDDVTLELLKAAVMATVSGAPIADETEMRLDEANDENLVFSWYEAAGEKRLATLKVPRSAYKDVLGDTSWNRMRAEFDKAAYVDLGRLLG